MEIFNFLHNNINKPILIFLNSFTDNSIIWNIVYLMSDLPIFIIPIFLIWFWFYNRKNILVKNKLLFIFYSCVVAISVSMLIQQFINLDRPEESIKNAWKLILDHIQDSSFPSDHASIWIAFLTSLILFWFVRFWIILLPFFIIMLLSRIASGIHWPFDIIIWSIIWIFTAFIIYKLQNINILKKINNFILKIANYLKL